MASTGSTPRVARHAARGLAAAVVGALAVATLVAACGEPGAGPAPDETSMPGSTAAPGASTAPQGPGPERPARPVPAPDGLTVSIRQSRSDWAARVVQVRVSNGSGHDIVVDQLSLTDGRFDGSAHGTRSRDVRDGVERDISAALGAPRCGDPSPAAPEVTMTITEEDGGRGLLTLVPEDPQGHLARITAEDCAAAAAAAGARIAAAETLGFATVDGREVATLDIDLEPVPGGPEVAVTQVSRTVILSPAEAPGAAAVVDAGWVTPGLSTSGATTATIAFVPGRCDRHAVAEDKRGTFLALHTTLDGLPQDVFYIPVSTAVRSAIFAFIGRSCGW